MQTERSSLDLNIRTLPIAEKVTTQHCLDLPRDSQVSDRKQIIFCQIHRNQSCTWLTAVSLSRPTVSTRAYLGEVPLPEADSSAPSSRGAKRQLMFYLPSRLLESLPEEQLRLLPALVEIIFTFERLIYDMMFPLKESVLKVGRGSFQ